MRATQAINCFGIQIVLLKWVASIAQLIFVDQITQSIFATTSVFFPATVSAWVHAVPLELIKM